jgi:hypothetical protein
MGFRVQLIAVAGKEPRAVQRAFGVTATGRREEIAESPVVGAEMPDGAYLLYINDSGRITPEDEVFARLSEDASLVACYVNETVMESYACAWADGAKRWSVFHDAQQGIKHLETCGALPPEFQAIRDRLFVQQNAEGGADFIFDIPVELFAAVGGIRYDHDLADAGPDPWEILEQCE